MQTSLISVLAVSVLALLAPVLTSRLRPVVVPVAAMEVVLGIVFGRTGFGFLQPTAVTAFLSLFGLSYLMFLSGLEVDVVRLMRPSTADRRGLATAALTAVALLGAGILGGLELQRLGIVGNGLALGLLLGSSAPTVVLPTLKEGRRTGTQFGRTVLLVSLLLDVVGLLGVSVIAGLRAGGPRALLFIILLVPLVAAVRLSGPLRRWWARQTLDSVTSQLGVRGALAIVVIFIAVAESLGTAAVLGAFAAGMTAAIVLGDRLSAIQEKLDAIGYGYFIPFFFILLGAQINAHTDLARMALLALLMVAAFVGLGLVASVVFGVRFGSWRNGLGAGMLLATHLSVTVAGSAILESAQIISAATATAVIVASVVSAIVLPPISLWLVPPRKELRQGVLLVGPNQRTRRLAARLASQSGDVQVVESLAAVDLAGVGTGVVLGESAENNFSRAEKLSEGGVPRVVVEVTPDLAKDAREAGWVPFTPELAASELLELLVLAPAGADLLVGHQDGEIIDVTVRNLSFDGVPLRLVALPSRVLIVSLARGRDHIVPRGQTVLRLGDVVTLLGSPSDVEPLRATFEDGAG